jgi:hypothetical protein
MEDNLEYYKRLIKLYSDHIQIIFWQEIKKN